MPKSIVITGAAGFLGRHFVRHHIDAGDGVIAIDDMSAEHALAPDIPSGRGHFFKGDVNALFTTWPTTEFDIAYHFASPVGGRVKIENDPFFNADAFRQDSVFFRWAAKNKPKRVVYPSSSAVYPIHMQTHNNPERLGLASVVPAHGVLGFPDSTYGFAKLAGEHLAGVLAEKNPDMQVLVIRPFSGYGPGQPADYPMTAIAQRALRKEDPLFVWGNGTQVRDFVHVDDIVDRVTNHKFKEDPWGYGENDTDNYNVINIGTGVGTSFIELARLLARKVGYEPEIAALVDKPAGVEYRVAARNPRETFIPLDRGVESVLASLEGPEWTSPLHA